MDTSNRHATLVLGRERVQRKDLTPEDWIAILRGVLEMTRPKLKYLGMMALAEYYGTFEVDEKILDGKVAYKDGFVGPNMHCLALGMVDYPSQKRLQEGEIGKREVLFVSSGGELIFMEITGIYFRRNLPGDGPHIRCSWHYRHSTVSTATDDDLIFFFAKFMPNNVIDALREIVEKEIENRENRLNGMRELHWRLKEASRKIVE